MGFQMLGMYAVMATPGTVPF